MYLSALLLYLTLLAAAAYWQSRTAVGTGDEFLVAGRALPARVLVFTLLSAWIGSGSLFAGAGLGYRAGMPALWQPAGAWAGIAAIYFVAARVQRLARYTVADILEQRYGASVRTVVTITTVIAYITITAYQFRAGGRLLSLVSGLNASVGAVLTAAFCVLYTSSAGMLSVARLDVANGLMMLLGAGAAVAWLIAHAGGLGQTLGTLRADQLTVFGTLNPVTDAVALFLPMMLLLMGEASMYQKLFSARSESAARRAVAGWIGATIVVETLIISIGIIGSAVMPGLNAAESETIVIRVALLRLPAILGFLLLCGGAAIVVSTANSFLLTAATNLMRDVVPRFMRSAATDQQVVFYTRALVIGIGAASVTALIFFKTILETTIWAYTMYAAAITPVLIAAFVWPRATRAGAITSMVSGMVMTALWELAGLLRATSGGEPGSFLGMRSLYPALVASLAALVVVSLRTQPVASSQ